MKFEDTVVKAKELIDAAEQKVTEAVTVQKIKYNIAKVKSEIEHDYQLLGRLYYSGVRKDNVDAEALKAIMEELDTELDKLRELEAELAFAKGNTVCDSCGAANDIEAEFCSKCGKEL